MNYDAQFESFAMNAPALGSPERADLGIDAMAREMERQSRGAQRVQDQVEANQRRLLEAAEIQAKNRGVNIDAMKKLAAFSKTAVEEVIAYQGRKNQEKEDTGYMKAYTEGYTPQEEAQFDEEIAGIDYTAKVDSAVAGEAQRNGAPPDVVARLKNMGNHEAMGYARGLLEQAGGDYSSFLSANRNKFSVRIGNRDVTLAKSKNQAEYATVERALRATYISQYSGLNPKLLNKYLFPSMKKAEDAAVVQWEKDLKEANELEETSTRRKELAAGFSGDKALETTVRVLDRVQASGFGGASARQDLASDLLYLLNGGMINANQLKTVLTRKFKDASGRERRLDQWPEFATLLEKADERETSDRKEVLDQENLRKAEAANAFNQLLPDLEAQNLSGPQRLRFALDFAQRSKINFSQSEYLQRWVNKPPENALELKLQLQQMAQRGIPIYEEMLQGYDSLRSDQIISKGLAAADGLTKANFDQADRELSAAVVKASKSVDARGLEAKPNAQRVLGNAKREVRRRYQQNLSIYGDPQQAMDKAINDVIEYGITPYDGTQKDEQGRYYGNLDASPLSPDNYNPPNPKEAEIVSIGQGQAEITRRANAGEDPFATLLPGSQNQLDLMLANIEDGKKDPIPSYYETLSRGQPYSKWHIANAQLKAAGKEPIPIPEEIRALGDLPPSAKALLQRAPIITRPIAQRSQYQTEMASDAQPYAALLSTIRGAEGGAAAYSAANRGTAGDTPGGAPGLETKTLAEWMGLQNSGYFALGAYQFIPGTLQMAAQGAGITPNTVMSPAVQDRLAIQLIMGGRKRPRLTRYLTGKSDDLAGAADALSLEWAAVANASGASAYAGTAGNAASISGNTAQRLLQELRDILQRSPYNQNENLTPGLR